MLRPNGVLLIAATFLAGAPAAAREACQERTLSLRYVPQASRSWCWAASGQMVMEILGEDDGRACQCRQVEAVLGLAGCCAAAGSCVPSAEAPARCDAARWPAFLEKPEVYRFEYRTTCDSLPRRHDDPECHASPIGWRELSVEICAGRPVIATFRAPLAAVGHTLVVKGFSAHRGRRVLLVDPARLCPPGRDCEGAIDEGFWVTYEEYAAGWDGRAHWVDFYGIRRVGRGNSDAASVNKATQNASAGRDLGGGSDRDAKRDRDDPGGERPAGGGWEDEARILPRLLCGGRTLPGAGLAGRRWCRPSA